MPRNKVDPAEIAREIAGLPPACVLGRLASGALSAPRGKETVSPKILVRRVSSGERETYQIERFEGQKAFHRNAGPEELASELASLLGSAYSRAEFAMEGGTIRVLANRRGELSVRRAGSTRAGTAPVDVPPSHDRAKSRLLPEGEPVPFLVDLGVMTAEGRVVKPMYAKYRQINRFLEFVSDVLPDLERAAAGRPLEIIDFGCGKSYLTFALHHYLAKVCGLRVNVTGLDLKDDVIERCSALASRLGCGGLRFLRGDIAGFSPDARPDLVVSLHACDTATDAALARAVRWKTPVILAVPCCQHELNTALSTRPASRPGEVSGAEAERGSSDGLHPALRHGILRERVSALFTDAIRAEALEASGYRVQILEFIDMEHTPKNLLIRAVRQSSPAVRQGSPQASDGSSQNPDAAFPTKLERYLGVELALSRELSRSLSKGMSGAVQDSDGGTD